MKKQIFFLLFGILLINFSSAMTLTNISLKSTDSNYSIFINNSITCSRFYVTNTGINIYSLSSKANFTNINTTQNSVLSLFSLTSPYNDIRWDNGTSISNDSTNTNVIILPNRRIEIGNFYTAPSPPTPPSGGGGGTTYEEINLDKVNYTYDKWIKGGFNEIKVFIYDVDENLFDPDLVNISIKDVNYTKNQFQLEEGIYLGEFIVIDAVDSVILEINVEDSWKNIYKEVKINLEKPTQLEKIQESIQIKADKFNKLISAYGLYLWIGLCAFVFPLFWILYFFKKNKKE